MQEKGYRPWNEIELEDNFAIGNISLELLFRLKTNLFLGSLAYILILHFGKFFGSIFSWMIKGDLLLTSETVKAAFCFDVNALHPLSLDSSFPKLSLIKISATDDSKPLSHFWKDEKIWVKKGFFLFFVSLFAKLLCIQFKLFQFYCHKHFQYM